MYRSKLVERTVGVAALTGFLCLGILVACPTPKEEKPTDDGAEDGDGDPTPTTGKPDPGTPAAAGDGDGEPASSCEPERKALADCEAK